MKTVKVYAQFFLATLRATGMTVCLVIFASWSLKAIYKLENKPIGSSVTFRNGDDNMGNLSYPVISVCRKHFQDLYRAPQVQPRCHYPGALLFDLAEPKNWNYVLNYCFHHKKNPFTSVDELTFALNNDTFKIGIHNFNFPPYLTSRLSVIFKAKANEIFYGFYMKQYGQCFSVDFSYFTKNMFALEDLMIEFMNYFYETNKSTKFIAAIHEFPQDRIEALTSQPYTIDIGNEVTVRVKKQVLKAIPSEEAPCADIEGYNLKYCELLQHEKIFVKKFGCALPWMNQPLRPNMTILDVQPCPISNATNNFTIGQYASEWDRILKDYQEFDACPKLLRCWRSFHDATESTQGMTDLTKRKVSRFVLRHVTNTVQTIVDSYTHDDQSFIGEVGGTLGLMLGYSCMSLIDLFEYAFLLVLEKCMRIK